MFQLDKTESSVKNLNVRSERHGDERVLAVDVKLETKVSNTILDSIDPDLRKGLFRKPGKNEQQELPTIGTELTAVKFPYIEPLKLNHEFEGYELELAGLLDGIEPVFLVDVKLKKLTVAPLEGGSVTLTLTASANVDADELSQLADAFVREDVRVSLVPPKKQAVGDTLDQQDAA